MSDLTPQGYRPRLVETCLDNLMRGFGCVEITGPKWCGKTWTALTRAASVTRLDAVSDREAAVVDPALALVGDAPHLVDEWQEVPEVWDACRRAIDELGNRRGLFLLTGSTSLSREQRERVRHTGAGRIARISLYPMTLLEMGEVPGGVSIRRLLKGERPQPMRCETTIGEVARWCCRGGWPANLGIDDDIAAETSAQYVRSVVDVNVVDEGRSPVTAMALLRALAMNESQAVTRKTLARDMGDVPTVVDETVGAYVELFDRLHVTEPLSGWEPPLRSKARVRVRPKRYFVDPSLAAALLGATR
jgi:predicted AAA+ superfamily ATPase